MNKKHLIFIIAIVIILIVLLLNPFRAYNYKRYSLSDGCINYYRDCTCIGELNIAESYPEQFFCQGFEFCNNINETACS